MISVPSEKPFCFPVCFQCRKAPCPRAVPIPERTARGPYWPDSLAGTRMECGCRVDIIPTVLGVLNPTHVRCATHGWQPLQERGKGGRRSGSGRGQRSFDDMEEEEKEEGSGEDGGRPPF